MLEASLDAQGKSAQQGLWEKLRTERSVTTLPAAPISRLSCPLFIVLYCGVVRGATIFIRSLGRESFAGQLRGIWGGTVWYWGHLLRNSTSVRPIL